MISVSLYMCVYGVQPTYIPKVIFYRLSDASGSMNFELVAEGDINKDMLDSNVSFSFIQFISDAPGLSLTSTPIIEFYAFHTY